jgi:hypothetical protein
MKTSYLAALLLFGVLNSFGQQGVGPSNTKSPKPKPFQVQSSPYSVVQRDANSRVWQSTNYDKLPSGELVPQVHSYTELGTGLNYQKNGAWKESREQIEPLRTGGAAALQGQHQVYFPYDIYQGVIETVTPDGLHLRSRPLGISYFDGTNSVLIAELTNSVGQILPSGNQVIYTNAFTDFAADLLVTYRKGGLECDLILREQPPEPKQFGLNPDTSRLEMLTEFLNSPEPVLKAAKVNPHSKLEDSTIEFGSMQMIEGKAFILGDRSESQPDVPVAKTWAHLEGRTFLIEEVSLPDVKPQLQQLPVSANKNSTPPGKGKRMASASRQLPVQRLATMSTNAVRMAMANVADKLGFALDYNLVASQANFTFQADTTYYVPDPINLSGTTTIEGNAVIKCVMNLGPSINILGTVNCLTGPYRPAVITSSDDSTVGETIPQPIGYNNTPYFLYMTNASEVGGNLWIYEVYYDSYCDCYNYLYFNQDTDYGDYYYPGQGAYYGIDFYSSYMYLAFYADDGSGSYIGPMTPQLRDGHLRVYQITPGYFGVAFDYTESGASLGAPAVATGLSLANGGALHDLRFCNLTVGISSSANYSVTNAQFVNCGTAFKTQNATLFAGNILMNNVSIGLGGQGFQATVVQLTYDQGSVVTSSSGGTSTATLKNSLLTAVASYGNIAVTTDITDKKLSSSSGVYQAVGGGKHYLATNSIYRGIGASLDAGMAAQLAQKTTYPPIAYTNVTFSTAQTFIPQAPRDVSATPDLGYHYDPLDYTFGGCTANANVTFAAGTAAGWFRKTWGTFHAGYGIHMADTTVVVFNGTATLPDYWVRQNTVQELDTTAGTGTAGIAGWATSSGAAPILRGTFLRASTMASESGSHFAYTDGFLNVQLTHGELWSGSVGGGFSSYSDLLNFTNCLADRCSLTVYGSSASVAMRNTTMRGGKFIVTHTSGSSWPADIADCAFEGTAISVNSGGNPSLIHYDYNAYLTGANRLTPTSANDKLVSSFNWQTGPSGRFYLPTDSLLINAGSRTANLAGLYHFTTQINQTKEGSSPVDMGYHYVSLVGNLPMDGDGDGLADYFEDANGDGVYNSTVDIANWGAADTDGDSVNDYLEWIAGRNPRVSGTTPDTLGNYISLLVY